MPKKGKGKKGRKGKGKKDEDLRPQVRLFWARGVFF